jgi:hypothetical protein
MDEERLQQMEKRLNEQAEATRAMNETLNKFLAVMANQEVARNVTPPPASPPPVTTPLKASHTSRVNPGTPSNFDGDRAQGRAFLISCELYISLSQSDFIEDQVRIHWALSYLKGGHCGEQCPPAFKCSELPSWIIYQDIQLLWDSGLVRGESGYSL